jgi:hypothetical protein
MLHCSWPGFFSLALVLAAAACGGDDPSRSEAEAGSDPSSATGAPEPGLRAEGSLFGITLDGTGQAMVGQARVEVVELEPTVKFTLTATYPGNPNDLLLLQLSLPGVDSVAGPHSFDLGRPYIASAFGIVALAGESYSSRSGAFDLTLGADGDMDGRFEASFSKDVPDDHPISLQDRDLSLSTSEALRMSGSFEGSWSLLCKSPVPVLPGDHSVSDSPYCNSLEF